MTEQRRLYSLDSLRAALMLLGLVVHTATSYIDNPSPESWPYSDPSRHVIFDVSLYIIHMFRMPAFFLLAGFFAQLLLEKRGVRAFLQNRAARILLPLLLFWPLLYLADAAAFARCLHRPLPGAITEAIAGLSWGSPLFGHLWFLHYLILFCAAWSAFSRATLRLCGPLVYRAIERPYALLLLVIPTASLLWCMPFATLISSETLLPKASPFLLCALFFVAGAALYQRQALFTRLAPRCWWSIGASLFLLMNNLGLLFLYTESRQPALLVVVASVGALAMWLMVLGWVGLFLRYFEEPRASMSYLSAASYWVYLTHHSLCILFVGVVSPISDSALLKFSLVVMIVAAITLVSYHLLVRRTWISVLLNGRRYESAL